MTSVSVRGKRECGETHRGDGHVKMEVKTEKRGHNPRNVEAAIRRRKRQGMYSPLEPSGEKSALPDLGLLASRTLKE